MEIVFRTKAKITIYSIIEFVDDLNTVGSGSQWFNRFLLNCEKYAQPNVQYSLCNFVSFSKRNFSFFTYNK